MKNLSILKTATNWVKSPLLVFLAISGSMLFNSCTPDDGEAPREPEEETETVLTLDNLKGGWIRVASNNPVADGLIIDMSGTSGELTDKAGSGFEVGDIKWNNIIAKDAENYDYEELGSDYNYYVAAMVLRADDTLRISVGSSGAGNIQKWVRDGEYVPVSMQSDCVAYTPNNIGPVVIEGTWTEANQRNVYENAIVINGDAGGGYVNVTLSQSDPDLRPALIVDTELNVGGVIIGGSSATTNNELIREASFSVHPGESYSIEAYPFFNAAQYPVDYTITWEFISKMDCFEPNDNQSQAKKIPLGETIEAFAIAGHRDYSVGAFEPQTYDWYKIELGTAGIVEAELLDMPNDMRIAMRIFNPDGSVQGADFEWTSPEDLPNSNGRLSKITTNGALEPGTYFIEVHSAFVSRKRYNDLEPLPDHFNKTYKMKVSRK